LAGRVLLKIVYLLVHRVLSLSVLLLRWDLAKDAELLALRTRTRCCAGTPGGYGMSRPTGCGSLRWRS
jgi:hypothetical protein